MANDFLDFVKYSGRINIDGTYVMDTKKAKPWMTFQANKEDGFFCSILRDITAPVVMKNLEQGKRLRFIHLNHFDDKHAAILRYALTNNLLYDIYSDKDLVHRLSTHANRHYSEFKNFEIAYTITDCIYKLYPNYLDFHFERFTYQRLSSLISSSYDSDSSSFDSVIGELRDFYMNKTKNDFVASITLPLINNSNEPTPPKLKL